MECGKVTLKAESRGSLYSVAYWAVAMEMISVEYLDAEKDGRRAAQSDCELVVQLVAIGLAAVTAALWVRVSVAVKAAAKADTAVDYWDGEQVALKELSWGSVLAGLSAD